MRIGHAARVMTVDRLRREGDVDGAAGRGMTVAISHTVSTVPDIANAQIVSHRIRGSRRR